MKKGALLSLLLLITGCYQQAQLDSDSCVSDQQTCQDYLATQCSGYPSYTVDSFNANASECPSLTITCESAPPAQVICDTTQLDNFAGCPC